MWHIPKLLRLNFSMQLRGCIRMYFGLTFIKFSPSCPPPPKLPPTFWWPKTVFIPSLFPHPLSIYLFFTLSCFIFAWTSHSEKCSMLVSCRSISVSQTRMLSRAVSNSSRWPIKCWGSEVKNRVSWNDQTTSQKTATAFSKERAFMPFKPNPNSVHFLLLFPTWFLGFPLQ